MIPKVWNIVETIISKEKAKRNLHVIAPTVVIVHEDQDKEITQLHKVEHIKIQEAIRRGNLRLCKLKKDWV